MPKMLPVNVHATDARSKYRRLAVTLHFWRFLFQPNQRITHGLRALFVVTVVLFLNPAYAGNDKYAGFFVGYETLEMGMNKFENFAGEIGYRFDDTNQLRLMIGEVNLTERHLSSSWEATAVDGKNVEGYFRVYELYYDRYFGKRKNWYYSGSVAYVRDKYNHTISENRIDNETLTVGFAIGYRKDDLFGIKRLYVNASMPFRYYRKGISETQWGDTTIRKHKFVNNIWLFVGYKF